MSQLEQAVSEQLPNNAEPEGPAVFSLTITETPDGQRAEVKGELNGTGGKIIDLIASALSDPECNPYRELLGEALKQVKAHRVLEELKNLISNEEPE